MPRSLVGEPLRLKQILINLTTNAIQFTAKGNIHIKIDEYDGWGHLEMPKMDGYEATRLIREKQS